MCFADFKTYEKALWGSTLSVECQEGAILAKTWLTIALEASAHVRLASLRRCARMSFLWCPWRGTSLVCLGTGAAQPDPHRSLIDDLRRHGKHQSLQNRQCLMVDTTNTWHSLELWPNVLSLIRIGSSWFTSSPRSFEYLPSEFGRPSGPWPNSKLGVLGMFTGAFGCLNTSMVEWWRFRIRFEFNNKNPKRRDS